jgi:drug/metabolite transporter (DMT)-like permease
VRGTLFVLICVALWALIPVVARFGQASLDNHQFLFWSSLVSFAVLTLNAALSGKMREIVGYTRADWGFIALLGLLGTYVYYLFLYLGYARASGLEVLVVQYTWPILIVALSLFLLREKLTLRKTIAIALGFLGVVTVLTKGDYARIDVGNPLVIALVGAGAFCFALFSVLSKKVDKTPIVVVSLYFLVALLASFVSMLSFSGFALPSRQEVWPILLNGVLVNGYSYIFWIRALRSTEASYLAPFTFLTPILSALYLVLLFDEPLVAAYALGLLLIVTGGLINTACARE